MRIKPVHQCLDHGKWETRYDGPKNHQAVGECRSLFRAGPCWLLPGFPADAATPFPTSTPHMSPTNSGRSLDNALAYASLRAILGLNIFLHGVVRLPNLDGFAEGLVSAFTDTILPDALVRLFAYGLAPVEAGIGVLLLIGWRTRGALVAGQVVMAALVFGTALRQEWGTLGTQMIYVSIYAALLFLHRFDGFGVDAWLDRE